MTKRRLTGTTLAAITVAVLIAVFVATASGSGVKSGGVFRLGTSSRIDSLNPFVAFNQDAYSTFMYIYPALIQYDRTNLHFAPDFAKSWQVSSDGKTWTFKTVAGATWTDGQPLTAADAAWTITTAVKYKNTGAANDAGLIAHITSAVATNPTTLVVHYNTPVGNVLSQFEQFPILPEHVWSKYTGHNGSDLKTFANPAPIVGAGPFKLVKFQKDQIALFQPDDTFYGPKPQISEFGLQMFSDDDALVAALKAHNIDAIEDVPATAIGTLKKSGFTIQDVPGADQTDFIFNSNPKKPKNRELLDPKVREAFDHAIDRAQIVRVVFLGTAKPGRTLVPPATGTWVNPAIQPTTFNLTLANKLLDGLGFTRGSGGIRVADGHKMSYTVITPTDLSSVNRSFEIIQADFQKIGVQLIQKALDSSAAFDAITAPNTKYLNFDLAMWDWVGLPDPDFMLSVVTCAQYGGWSDTGFCDKAYDAMYAQQQVTLNLAKRRALVWKMESYLAARRPYLWLATEDHVSAVSSQWTGLVESMQGPFNALSKLSLTDVHQT